MVEIKNCNFNVSFQLEGRAELELISAIRMHTETLNILVSKLIHDLPITCLKVSGDEE